MSTSVVVPFWFIMKSVMQECLQAIKELMSTANNYGIEKYKVHCKQQQSIIIADFLHTGTNSTLLHLNPNSELLPFNL